LHKFTPANKFFCDNSTIYSHIILLLLINIICIHNNNHYTLHDIPGGWLPLNNYLANTYTVLIIKPVHSWLMHNQFTSIVEWVYGWLSPCVGGRLYTAVSSCNRLHYFSQFPEDTNYANFSLKVLHLQPWFYPSDWI